MLMNTVSRTALVALVVTHITGCATNALSDAGSPGSAGAVGDMSPLPDISFPVDMSSAVYTYVYTGGYFDFFSGGDAGLTTKNRVTITAHFSQKVSEGDPNRCSDYFYLLDFSITDGRHVISLSGNPANYPMDTRACFGIDPDPGPNPLPSWVWRACNSEGCITTVGPAQSGGSGDYFASSTLLDGGSGPFASGPYGSWSLVP